MELWVFFLEVMAILEGFKPLFLLVKSMTLDVSLSDESK